MRLAALENQAPSKTTQPMRGDSSPPAATAHRAWAPPGAAWHPGNRGTMTGAWRALALQVPVPAAPRNSGEVTRTREGAGPALICSGGRVPVSRRDSWGLRGSPGSRCGSRALSSHQGPQLVRAGRLPGAEGGDQREHCRLGQQRCFLSLEESRRNRVRPGQASSRPLSTLQDHRFTFPREVRSRV